MCLMTSSSKHFIVIGVSAVVILWHRADSCLFEAGRDNSFHPVFHLVSTHPDVFVRACCSGGLTLDRVIIPSKQSKQRACSLGGGESYSLMCHLELQTVRSRHYVYQGGGTYCRWPVAWSSSLLRPGCPATCT